jgi:hypothetical protein
MAQASAPSVITLARRFGAFVTERYPFALNAALEVFDAAGGELARDEQSIEKLRARFGPELRARLREDRTREFAETTPGVEAGKRFGCAVDELSEATGFCVARRFERR